MVGADSAIFNGGLAVASPSESRSYAVSAARLYSAAVRTVSQLGYSIQHTDATTRAISFNTGMSMRSWGGQDMTAIVTEDAAGASTVIVGGRRAQRGAPDGGGGQIFDWGERGKITRLFFDELKRALHQTPEQLQVKLALGDTSVDGASSTINAERTGKPDAQSIGATSDNSSNSQAGGFLSAETADARAEGAIEPGQASIVRIEAPERLAKLRAAGALSKEVVQGEQLKKPFYKRVWFWIVFPFALLLLVGILNAPDDSTNLPTSASSDSEPQAPDACDDSDVADMVKGAIENNAASRVVTLQVLDFGRAHELYFDKKSNTRFCEGDAALNTGETKLSYRLFFGPSNGELVEVKEGEDAFGTKYMTPTNSAP